MLLGSFWGNKNPFTIEPINLTYSNVHHFHSFPGFIHKIFLYMWTIKKHTYTHSLSITSFTHRKTHMDGKWKNVPLKTTTTTENKISYRKMQGWKKTQQRKKSTCAYLGLGFHWKYPNKSTLRWRKRWTIRIQFPMY